MKDLATLSTSTSPKAVPDVFACKRDGVALLPRGDCEKIIAEAGAWAGCGVEIAAGMAKILVGSYPARKMADEDVYLRAIISVLAEAPAWACKQAVDFLTRNQKFLPTRAEIVSELAGIRAKQAQRVRAAREHLEAQEPKPQIDRVAPEKLAELRRALV